MVAPPKGLTIGTQPERQSRDARPMGLVQRPSMGLARHHSVVHSLLLTAFPRHPDDQARLLMPFARRARAVSLLVVAALLMGPMTSAFAAIRVEGASRVTTAVEVSRTFFDQADTVIVARADSFADALAGAPLAGLHRAPLLLVDVDRVSREVKDEIARLGARTVIVLGGPGAVSTGVVRELGATRIAGPTRWDTAAAVADAVMGSAASVDRVFLATGHDFPDAIAVAGLAAAIGAPILLSDTTTLPYATVRAIKALGPSLVTLVGGDGVLTESVARQVRSLGPRTDRLAGQTRYETSAAIVRASVDDPGLSGEHRLVVSGEGYADALAAAPAAARTDRVMALAPRMQLGPAPLAGLDDCDLDSITIIGGLQALSPTVEERLDAAVDGNCAGDPSAGVTWRSEVATQRAASLLAAHRSALGLSATPRVSSLDEIAFAWSESSASDDTLRHNPSLGGQAQDYQAIAENVGVARTSDGWITEDDLARLVDKLHRDFLASPVHRDNMQDARWDDVGIGVVVRGNALWLTVVFRQRA